MTQLAAPKKTRGKHLRIQVTLRRHHPLETMVLTEIERLEAGGHVSRTQAVRVLLQELPETVDAFVFPNRFKDAADLRRTPVERVSFSMRFYPGKPVDVPLGKVLNKMPRDAAMRAEHLRSLLVFAVVRRRATEYPELAHLLAEGATAPARPGATVPSPAPASPAPAASSPQPASGDTNPVPITRAGPELLKLFAGKDDSLEDVAARVHHQGAELRTGST